MSHYIKHTFRFFTSIDPRREFQITYNYAPNKKRANLLYNSDIKTDNMALRLRKTAQYNITMKKKAKRRPFESGSRGKSAPFSPTSTLEGRKTTRPESRMICGPRPNYVDSNRYEFDIGAYNLILNFM